MTNKECRKAAEDQKKKADLINESINWAADKKDLDKYGDELQKVMEECSCKSGNINF